MKNFLIPAFMLAVASGIAAKDFDRNALINPYSLNRTGGLLDPSRFSVSHSYSMSYASASTGYSSWDGLYLSTLRYAFSVPVTLSLDMGFSHQPAALLKAGPFNSSRSNGFVFPRLELRYQPFENTLIRIEYFDHRGMPANPLLYNGIDARNLLFTPDERKPAEH